jgi:hypothetical protein
MQAGTIFRDCPWKNEDRIEHQRDTAPSSASQTSQVLQRWYVFFPSTLSRHLTQTVL